MISFKTLSFQLVGHSSKQDAYALARAPSHATHNNRLSQIGIGIYQGFTAFAEGYPYKILDLLARTLLI